jgi:F-type H+-transporting ATPase subunit epsilon
MHLDIITPRGPLLSAVVDEFTAPGTLGEVGVLPGHIPFLSGVRAGVVRWRRGGEGGVVAVGPGFLEVSPGQRCALLAAQGALAETIDAAAVRAELADAEKQLDRWDSEDAGARLALEAKRDWARACLDAAGGAHAAPASGH